MIWKLRLQIQKQENLQTLQRWWKGLKTRGSTEIIGLILQAVERQALTRSKIMYHAILNFKQVTDYTAFLTKEGLLTYLSQDRKYIITDRGRQFLTLFKETNKLLTTHYDDMADNNEEQNLQEPPPQQQQKHQVALHKQQNQ
ncbi:MAG TPA: winged helix-turn-helix domain-containing protein [Nitrososphaeraceae archaeon]|nr:winged helix-turn-helix domain-containing protein [Nitrososphaeraceae archaeon]